MVILVRNAGSSFVPSQTIDLSSSVLPTRGGSSGFPGFQTEVFSQLFLRMILVLVVLRKGLEWEDSCFIQSQIIGLSRSALPALAGNNTRVSSREYFPSLPGGTEPGIFCMQS